MEFTALTPQEYEAFRNQHPYRGFMSSLKTMNLKRINHWDAECVEIKEQGKIICATPLTSIPVTKLYWFYYAQRGFLMDYHDVELLHFFAKELATYLRRKRSLYLVVDPNVLYRKHGIDGELVENSFDHSYVVDDMIASGHEHQGFTKGFQVISEVRQMFALYLDGKDENTLLEEMHQQTRWSVNKTLRQGVQVRELSIDGLDTSLDMTHHASQHCGFTECEPEFYRNQMIAYGEDTELLLTYLDLNDFRKKLDLGEQSLRREHVEILAKLEELSSSKKFIEEKKVLDEALALNEKEYEDTDTLEQEHGACIPMTTSLSIRSQDELVYLYSAAYDTFKKYNAPCTIQWHMLQYALKCGIRKYNSCGLSGDFDKNAQDYEVYEFKKGFHGVVGELAGGFILPIQKGPYVLYKKLKNKQFYGGSIQYQSIEQIDAREHDASVSKHKLYNLLQSSSWGLVKENWKHTIVGVRYQNQLVVSYMILVKPLPLEFSMFYIPREPVLSFSNTALVAFLMEELKRYARKYRYLLITFDPAVHCSDYTVKEVDENHCGHIDAMIWVLQDQGAVLKGSAKHTDGTIQPRHHANVYACGGFNAALPKDCRKALQTVQKKTIEALPCHMDGIKDFARIMHCTEERKDVHLRDQEYFQRLIEIYGKSAVIFLAKLLLRKLYEDTKQRYEQNEGDLAKCPGNTEKKRFTLEELHASLNCKVREPQEDLERDGDIAVVSGTLCVKFGPTAEILYAGMDERYKHYMAPYASFYSYMTWSFEKGCRWSSTRGIEGSLKDGLTKLKTNYNPTINEFIGEFDLPVYKSLYALSQWAMKQRKKALQKR